MYRIYINEIRLFITEIVPNTLKIDQFIDLKGLNWDTLFQKAQLNKDPENWLIQTEDPDFVFKQLNASLQLIEAAGGLVKNTDGAYLFIHRRGKWDLPKGKIDDGESPEIAALREVNEECGIVVDQLESILAQTYHIYQMHAKWILKKTYWYKMQVDGLPKLSPQLEEDITEAVWLKKSEWEQVKSNTYPLILDLLDEQLRA